jgi:hypothetical protein
VVVKDFYSMILFPNPPITTYGSSQTVFLDGLKYGIPRTPFGFITE